TVIASIKRWLQVHPDCVGEAPLFCSRKTRSALMVPTLCNMVKRWCGDAGVRGNFGSHTLRKTWGYHQRVQAKTPVALLVSAYKHSSERQTLEYLGIEPSEIADLYLLLQL